MNRRSFFGTVATGRVYFNIRLDRSGALADWPLALNIQEHEIPYSNPPISDEEWVSILPSSVTWRLWFPDLDTYWAMARKAGQVDTLHIVAGVQSHRDSARQIDGVQYDVLPHTTLRGVGNVRRSVANGVEADVTFRRLMDPGTGQAVAP